MLSSIRTLLDAPYNKGRTLPALVRFFTWKSIRALKISNVRFRIWGDRSVILHHDSVQAMWLMYNYWVDWEEFHLIRDLVKEDDTVFDVGSNIGFYSLWMSRFCTKGTIHSFDPDEKNFARFGKNIAINGISNIKANKIGVSDSTGSLFFTQNTDTLNHVSYEKVPGAVEIQTITLDEYCRQNNVEQIAYLKVDIEGFEMAAFKGAENLLRNAAVGVIQLEINSAVNNAGVTEAQLLAYLNGFGYRLARYDIQAKKLERVELTRERENYFAVKDLEKINDQLC